MMNVKTLTKRRFVKLKNLELMAITTGGFIASSLIWGSLPANAFSFKNPTDRYATDVHFQHIVNGKTVQENFDLLTPLEGGGVFTLPTYINAGYVDGTFAFSFPTPPVLVPGTPVPDPIALPEPLTILGAATAVDLSEK